MKTFKKSFIIVFALLLAGLAHLNAETRPGYNTSSGFFVKNGKLYDKNGNEFIIRGVNATWAWHFDKNKNATDNMKHVGFNSVRIVWETGLSASNLDIAIETVVNNKMIPMVELHDFTGSDSYNDLQTAAQWWVNNKWVINKWEDYVLLNIANEWSSGVTATQYKNAYVDAINTIRNAGIKATLVIDARHYGKDQYTIRNVVGDIFNADPQKNIVFSQHMYCGSGSNGVWGVGEDPALIKRDLDWWKNNGYCAIVGEFADRELYGGNCDPKEDDIRKICQDNGQGYMWWSWDGAYGNGQWYYCIGANNNWEPWNDSDLSPWAYEMIVADTYSGIRATSIECSVFGVSTVSVTGVSVSPTSTSIAVNSTQQLSATVSPSNATNKNVSWSSSNTSVATVSSSGLVTGKAAGSATITVTTQDGGKTATSAITVTSSSGVTIPAKIEAENWTAMNGVQTQTTSDAGGGLNVGWIHQGDWMDYTINVPTAGTYTVDLRLASPNSGRQLQLRRGTTTLATVTVPNTGNWQNWQTVSTTVSLSAGTQTLRILASLSDGWNINWFELKGGSSSVAVTSVSVSPTSTSVTVNGTQQLSATVLPSNASNKNVTWSSSNTSIATVSSTGLVTGKVAGSATITVTTQDGGKTATCAVTVTAPGSGTETIYNDTEFTYSSGWGYVSGLTDGRYMGDEHYTSTSGASYTFAFSGNQIAIYGTKDSHHGLANVRIDGGASTSISYYSSTREVNQLIWISPVLTEGNHTITVTSASSAVIVADKNIVYSGSTNVPVTGVSVSPTSASVAINGTQQLSATVSPSDASNKNVTWHSNNTSVATVNSSGLVTGVAGGSATITVTTQDGGYTATCALNVTTSGGGESSVYIQNRWKPTQYLYDAGDNCGYGNGLDNSYEWIIEDVDATWKRFKNVATGHYLNIEGNPDAVKAGAIASDKQSSHWRINEYEAGYMNIKNRAYTGSRIHVENQLGFAQHKNVNDWNWSAQWDISLSTSKSETITNNLDGIDKNDVPISIYPNPARNYVTINVANEVNAFITVLDLNGRIVKEHYATGNLIEVNLNGIEAGVYIINIKGGNTNTIRKLIIK